MQMQVGRPSSRSAGPSVEPMLGDRPHAAVGCSSHRPMGDTVTIAQAGPPFSVLTNDWARQGDAGRERERETWLPSLPAR